MSPFLLHMLSLLIASPITPDTPDVIFRAAATLSRLRHAITPRYAY